MGSLRVGLGPPALHNALNKFRRHPWFKPWLLRGANLPSEIKLVTPLQSNAVRKAWHYTELCLRAGIQRDTYARWIRDGVVTDDWRPWLYGEASPTGVFVIDLSLLRLQEQMTEKGIATAPGVDLNEGTIFHWKKQPELLRAFEWIIAWAKRAGVGLNGTPPWPEWAMSLRSSTRKNMLAYVRAGKLCPMLRTRSNSSSHLL
jgi:hypothetical protein